MNETHLEHPSEVRTAIAELTAAIGDLTVEQELRRAALSLAVRCFLKANSPHTDVLATAETFYKFLSDDGSED